jgi:LysM repeat protein
MVVNSIVTLRKYIDIFFNIRLKSVFWIILCVSSLQVNAQKLSAKYLSYIEQYKELAIKHQQEYGIPASITLAQGLLESQAGQSPLAVNGNNHFGIKCHNSWKGDTVRQDDDAPQECFRKYGSAEDSFTDHARFLKGKRYAPLYQLDITDYKGWAQTLKDCGYATDPTYPEKLISIIERYGLNQYDSKQPRLASNKVLKPDETLGHDADATEDNAILREVAAVHTIHQKWGLHYVKAMPGDTYEAIANEFDVKLKKILDFNDIKDKKATPRQGSIVYLEKKEKAAPEGFDTYTVRRGDNLLQISQVYGIRLGNLMKMNSLKDDAVIKPGDVLRLR